MKKLFFVMNPAAGMRKANKLLPEILTELNKGEYDVITHITTGQGDARKVVSQRAKDMDLIVCCGGDGTFNETVAGVLESKANVPIGYIPAGSTNDFAASLGLEADPVQAARAIIKGKSQTYDVGCFGGRFFTYVASFGAFTKASYTTPQNVKNALGHTAYLLEGIQELSQLRKAHVRFEFDDRVVEDDFLFGAISNSTSVGGILTLDPKQVDMRDGKFELLLVRAPRDLMELSDCIRALQTQKYNCAMITFLSTSSLTVYASPEMDWSLDGERQAGRDRIFVENLHHAISIQK